MLPRNSEKEALPRRYSLKSGPGYPKWCGAHHESIKMLLSHGVFDGDDLTAFEAKD